MGLKERICPDYWSWKQETERLFQMKRKMKYLALYALPDISEAKEDLEICHDDITQDKAQEILIAKLRVGKHMAKT